MAETTMRAAPATGAAPSSVPLTRKVEEAPARHGRATFSHSRMRLFPYDYIQGGKTGRVVYGIDTADRMSVPEAADMLFKIHSGFGLVAHGSGGPTFDEAVLYRHDEAMFLCYAFNGASQLGPYERVSYSFVGDNGVVNEFQFLEIYNVLGVNMRRFFRAYANEVVDACRRLYNDCDVLSPDMMELREHMIALADRRGVPRHPWLIPDCAEAATNLSPVERASVAASKVAVIGGTVNNVDRRNLAKVPVRSLESDEGTAGSAVASAEAAAAPSGYYRN